MIFWSVSDIRKSARISVIRKSFSDVRKSLSDVRKHVRFFYQKFMYFLISEIRFSDIRNYFLISEIIYYHVVLVSTYVPTKMSPFFRPRYPFGWILKVLSIQKSKRVKIYELPFIDRYLNGSFFSSTCNSRYPNGSLFWFNPHNICILLIIISLINMSNIMWLLNLKVYVSCLVSCLHHLRCTI